MPVVAYAGDADPVTTVDDVRAWSSTTTGSFACRVFPGRHFFPDEHRDELLDDLADRIRRHALGVPDR